MFQTTKQLLHILAIVVSTRKFISSIWCSLQLGKGFQYSNVVDPRMSVYPRLHKFIDHSLLPMTHSQQPARRRLWTSSPPGLPLRPAMELWIHKGKWKHCDKTEDKSTKKCEFIMLESTNRILRYWMMKMVVTGEKKWSASPVTIVVGYLLRAVTLQAFSDIQFRPRPSAHTHVRPVCPQYL